MTVKIKIQVAEETPVTEVIDVSPLTESVDQKLPLRRTKRKADIETKTSSEVTKAKAEEAVVTKRARRK